jgi:hypothetical protein
MAEPIEPPTPVMVPVTPFVDGREVDLDLGLVLFAFDRERGELRALEERLELVEAPALRAEARLAGLRPRDGELPLLRVEPAELALRLVFVWAMVTHLPQSPHFLYNKHPALGMADTPARQV